MTLTKNPRTERASRLPVSFSSRRFLVSGLGALVGGWRTSAPAWFSMREARGQIHPTLLCTRCVIRAYSNMSDMLTRRGPQITVNCTLRSRVGRLTPSCMSFASVHGPRGVASRCVCATSCAANTTFCALFMYLKIRLSFSNSQAPAVRGQDVEVSV